MDWMCIKITQQFFIYHNMTNKTEQVILHFLNKGYGDLTEYRTDEYPNHIFHIRDKKVYMEQTLENGRLCVNYYEIWKDLVEWFSLKYEDIKSIISKWVDQTYNIRGVVVYFVYFQHYQDWDKLKL